MQRCQNSISAIRRSFAETVFPAPARAHNRKRVFQGGRRYGGWSVCLGFGSGMSRSPVMLSEAKHLWLLPWHALKEMIRDSSLRSE